LCLVFVKSTVKLTNVRCNPQAPFCAVTVSLAPPGRTPEMVLRVAFSTSARIDDAGSDKGAGSASGGGGGGDDLAWLKGKIDRLEGKMDAIEMKGDAATDFDAKLLASLYEQLATDKQIELIKLQNEVTTGVDTTVPLHVHVRGWEEGWEAGFSFHPTRSPPSRDEDPYQPCARLLA